MQKDPTGHDVLSRSAGILLFKSPWDSRTKGFKGRPDKVIEGVLLRILESDKRREDWEAALGLAWRLHVGDNTNSVGRWPGFPLPNLMAALQRHLKKEAIEQRYLAALTLALMGEQDAAVPIVQLLQLVLEPDAWKKHPWLQSAALWTVAGNYDPGYLESIAISVLAQLRAESAREVLRDYAKEKSAHRRIDACEALSAMGDESILPVVRDFLNSKEQHLKDGHFTWSLEDLTG